MLKALYSTPRRIVRSRIQTDFQVRTLFSRVELKSPLQLQLTSNLNLERSSSERYAYILNKLDEERVKDKKNVIGLCGDIGHVTDPKYRDFLEWCSDRYEATFVVSGNHEYWSNQYTKQQLDEMMAAKIKTITLNLTLVECYIYYRTSSRPSCTRA